MTVWTGLKMRKYKADVAAVISKFGLTANFTFFTFTLIFTFFLSNFCTASRRNFVTVFGISNFSSLNCSVVLFIAHHKLTALMRLI